MSDEKHAHELRLVAPFPAIEPDQLHVVIPPGEDILISMSVSDRHRMIGVLEAVKAQLLKGSVGNGRVD